MMDGGQNPERLVPKVKISCVVDINPGVDKSAFGDDDLLPFIPMPAVEALTGRIDISERRRFGDVRTGFTSFQSGDVLFAKITPCMENGKMAIFPDTDRRIGFGSTEFHVLRPTAFVDSRYLYYFVASAAFRQEAQHNMTGAVGQKRVPKEFIADQDLPIVPIDEQRRIAERVEMLFSQLDKGEEAIRTVQVQLKRYRQSVLKAAVSGELVSTKRKKWREVKLGTLLDDIRYGTAKKCQYDTKGVAVLRIPNVVSGNIDLSDLKFTVLDENEKYKLSLKENDILIVRSNGSASLVGRCAVVDKASVGMAFAGYLIRLRVRQEALLPKFLHVVLESPRIRAKIERQARSSSGVHNVNSSEVKAIEFSLPPIEVQADIVDKVTGYMRTIKNLEDWCETELARASALRQSILKDAFVGNLVPQNLSDEVSSELLARIKAARAAIPKKTRGRPKRQVVA